jgi:hypothetical protein
MAYGSVPVGMAYQPEPSAIASKSGAIADQVGQLEKNLAILHELIGRVEGRLDAVLRPIGPEPVNKPPERLNPTVPLAGAIADQNHGLMLAHGRLMSLIDRVEL